MRNQLKLWEAAALMALCVTLCAGTWAQGKQESISSGLVRLHVVAVSDDEQEQTLKLRVRDAVLEYLTPLLKDVDSPKEARERIGANLPQLALAAQSAAEGRPLSLSLQRESFPTREYEGFILPAGEYESLRIILGEGKGHNWWCVVFPPLCLSAAGTEELEGVMSGEDLKIITDSPGYELRFKIVELWGELTQALK